jgi:hypothetical protein
MWPQAILPFFGATSVTLMVQGVASNSNSILSLEMPGWAQTSVVFLVIFLLIWLITQSQMRYDKLLERMDTLDVAKADVEDKRLAVEKERIVADVQQTAQIASLGRTIERLDATIKENTAAVRAQ